MKKLLLSGAIAMGVFGFGMRGVIPVVKGKVVEVYVKKENNKDQILIDVQCLGEVIPVFLTQKKSALGFEIQKGDEVEIEGYPIEGKGFMACSVYDITLDKKASVNCDDNEIKWRK